jgi:uncharacterized protein YdaU (DUF1376 family)
MIIAEPAQSYGKDAYYFSHDSNARNDQKCLKLRRVLGMEGYGIFWVLVEMLRESTNYRLPLTSVADIAYETRVSDEKILAVIQQFGLFEVEDGEFFSLRLNRSMELMHNKSKKASLSAYSRWKKPKELSDGNANAMRTHTERNAIKGKEIKGNEIKVDDSLSYYKDKVECFNNWQDNQMLIEEMLMLIRKFGFKSAENKHVINIFRNFLLVEFSITKTKADHEQHLRRWVNKIGKNIHEYAS